MPRIDMLSAIVAAALEPGPGDRVLEAALAPEPAGPDPILDAALAHHKTPVVKFSGSSAGIVAAQKAKQILYCVAMEPDALDTYSEHSSAADIEDAAHRYLASSRIVKSMHAEHIDAHPVESYIAPMDMAFDDPVRGRQTVPKGSWVMGIKVRDPQEWSKVESGFYNGLSIGGFGLREE